MPFLESLRLDGLLSFPPDSPAIEMRPLNVLIGPNGSGKSNLIEAVELLHATPHDLASAIRLGAGAREFIWKGSEPASQATIEAVLSGDETHKPQIPPLNYRLSLASIRDRTELIYEAVELKNHQHISGGLEDKVRYMFGPDKGTIIVRTQEDERLSRPLDRESLKIDQSILSQRKDPYIYPELTWLGNQFGRIQTFRDWSFGRYAPVRQTQRTDLPPDPLLPDARNLGLMLNELVEHDDIRQQFVTMMRRFLPRFEDIYFKVSGGSIQFHLRETGIPTPVPATRLSDGTLRFMALLAILLAPDPPPLICLDEPELGLHPDAVAMLCDLLIEKSKLTQLIVVTHSDTLLSALGDRVESVLVCEWSGGTKIRRLSGVDLKSWLDDYTIGEAWRVGALGGNP